MFEYDMRVIAKKCRRFRDGLRTSTLCIVGTMDETEAPAEAQLIDAAQKSAVPKLSIRKAAEMAGMSDGRWRQIVKGYQGTGTGRIPVVAPDETLARMAIVVGVTPDQLESADRPAAADVLRALLADSQRPDVELSTVSTDRLLGEIRRRIDGASHVTKPALSADTPQKPRTQAEAKEEQKTAADLGITEDVLAEVGLADDDPLWHEIASLDYTATDADAIKEALALGQSERTMAEAVGYPPKWADLVFRYRITQGLTSRKFGGYNPLDPKQMTAHLMSTVENLLKVALQAEQMGRPLGGAMVDLMRNTTTRLRENYPWATPEQQADIDHSVGQIEAILDKFPSEQGNVKPIRPNRGRNFGDNPIIDRPAAAHDLGPGDEGESERDRRQQDQDAEGSQGDAPEDGA